MNNTYKRTSKTTATIISTSDMKEYLRVDNDYEDSLIASLVSVAVLNAEKMMNRDLLLATYENYRDSINQDLTLRRGEFYSLDKIEYMVDEEYILLAASNYTVAGDGIFGKIYSIDLNASYDDHPEAIKITFKAGYGLTASTIPADIINAIKAHVAYMYENRGDTLDIIGQGYADFEKMKLPITVSLVYSNYRIIDVAGVL